MNNNMNFSDLFEENNIPNDLVSKLKIIPYQKQNLINWDMIFNISNFVILFSSLYNLYNFINIQEYINYALYNIIPIINQIISNV
jgi:hypothetical protein